MDAYDLAGGGLVAGGLAYTSLLALLPGLLLALSAAGFMLRDPADQERLIALIAEAVPPLEDVARLAFRQVSSGAVPSGIIAIVTLLWGSSRFYANLDTALSRIFRGAPRRNPVVQTVRGVVLTAVLVLVPVSLVIVGSVAAWAAQLALEGVDLGADVGWLFGIVAPIGLLGAYGVAVALCYRFVPSEHVPWQALLLPAAATGLVLAALTQIYAFVAPRLVGVATLYGTVFAVFGLLAWLSIAFNVLLVGAAWTDVRKGQGLRCEVDR